MRRFRLWPQSLVGQIIVLVAIALFVAQAINFGLLLRERNRLTLTAQTAPGVYRIVDALDSRGEPPARGRPPRARFFRAPPNRGGSPDRTKAATRTRTWRPRAFLICGRALPHRVRFAGLPATAISSCPSSGVEQLIRRPT